MNFEITAIEHYNPIIQVKRIEYTLLSVKMPEPIQGTTIVLTKSNGKMVSIPYHELTKSELKHEKYEQVYYIQNNIIHLNFNLTLKSDTMEVLMKALLNCQVKITNQDYIVKHNITDLSYQIGIELYKKINGMSQVVNPEVIEFVNKVIYDIQFMTNLDLEYAEIKSCAPTNIVITDAAKREREKSEVEKALKSNDLFTLTENGERVDEMLRMNDKLGQSKVDTIKKENDAYDLIMKRHKEMEENNMIPNDVNMSEFKRNIAKIDSGFNATGIEANSEEEPIEQNDKDQKAYFEE